MTAQAMTDACLHSFLVLLARQSPDRITLSEVAAGAGRPLSELRAAFSSVDDMLAAFFRATDRRVLAEGEADRDDLAEESPQERLFEVLMRRIDALEPHKEAVRSLMRAAHRDPLLALRLARLSERSQRWMLAAAGIDCTGLAGEARAKGLAVMFARVVDVWLKDDDPGLSRTMAALDQELANGAKMLGMLDDLLFILMPWRSRRQPADRSRPDTHGSVEDDSGAMQGHA
ncbi:TetR/AcrR family transcriptional regulator [Xanthobacter sp. TB0139]|uniref:TetR/AcrR family transcriptional regulator n=1 Tax=Xanthobacter sp. TB0139 TaxID=3459178 RepID=UPI0040399F0F